MMVPMLGMKIAKRTQMTMMEELRARMWGKPGQTERKMGKRTEMRRMYMISGNTVSIWKKRKILAATVSGSVR